MLSFLVAQSVVGVIKALPRGLAQVNATLDVLLAAKSGEARAVVDVSLGVSAAELRELMASPAFRAALRRGELLRDAGSARQRV